MKQQVIFDLMPSSNPDAVVGHSRTVVNVSTGMGMDILEQIITNHVPVVDHNNVTTEKNVIRVERYECPCCPTYLMALVEVSCQGTMTDDWKRVQGLYRVQINPDIERGDCAFSIEKLRGTTIHEGRCVRLPKKDYGSLKR